MKEVATDKSAGEQLKRYIEAIQGYCRVRKFEEEERVFRLKIT